MKKADKLFSKFYLIFGVFVLISFASYFLKLVISAEGTLPWVVTTGVMAAVILPFVFRKLLRKILKKAYVPLKGIMCAGMIFYTVTFMILVGYIYLSPSASPVSDTGEARVYIVFGAKVKEDGPTKTLAARLEKAAELMEADSTAICIVSGGKGPDEPETEASSMRRYMVSLGVDPARIYLEEEASNTRENIRYSVELIRELGLEWREIVCVSSDTHIPRIRLMCHEEGVDALYVKAETPQKQFLFTAWVREYLSYAKMLLLGA
ncbi:MAG: YdcF family protein [Clostridia bacterium]|nr:YdcF family protein [Clostridia bacterium]